MNNLSLTRFDFIAKYLYIKYYEKIYKSNFYLNLYKKHIEVFNKCWEHPGTKTKIQDFINSFNKLIEYLKKEGFSKKYPIEVGKNKVLNNGIHRFTVSYYYNIDPIIKNVDCNGCDIYNYDFFKNRNNYWRRDNEQYVNLDEIYLDTMALEYVRLNKNMFPIVLYPKSQNYLNKEIKEKLDKIIEKYGYIYYKKKVKLTEKGMLNLIKELYRGEKWLGGMFPRDEYAYSKLKNIYCDDYIEIIILSINDTYNLRNLKEMCRKLFPLEKNSLHIPDNHKDGFRICSSLLNSNSIYFLNNSSNDFCSVSERMNKLNNYFNLLKEDNIDYCITSSIILEMYGLRDAKDIDYLHRENKDINLPFFGSHKGKWLDFYHVSKEEIIYNPKYHFYFNGFKFATLDVIKIMKQNRNEEKDKRDILLINKII